MTRGNEFLVDPHFPSPTPYGLKSGQMVRRLEATLLRLPNFLTSSYSCNSRTFLRVNVVSPSIPAERDHEAKDANFQSVSLPRHKGGSLGISAVVNFRHLAGRPSRVHGETRSVHQCP